MALDDILGGLSVKDSNGKVKVNSSYDAERLVDAYEGLKELDGLNLSTSEGLQKYVDLTGDDSKAYSEGMINKRKEMRIAGGNEDLSKYVEEHFSKVIDGLDEDVQASIGYTFCPNKDSSANHTQYNATRKVVHEKREILNMIAKDPERYFAVQMANQSPLMQRYLAMDIGGFLEIEKDDSSRTAMLAIQGYGANKFLGVSKKIFEGQKKTFEDGQKVIQDNIGAKVKAEGKRKQRTLTAHETTEIISGDMDKLKKLAEDNPGAVIIEKFNNEIFTGVLESVKKARAASKKTP